MNEEQAELKRRLDAFIYRVRSNMEEADRQVANFEKYAEPVYVTAAQVNAYLSGVYGVLVSFAQLVNDIYLSQQNESR